MFKSQFGSAFVRLFALLAFALSFAGAAHAQTRPTLSLSVDASVLEGAPVNFRVTLSSPATQRLTFFFGTFNNGGTTGARSVPDGAFDADYITRREDFTIETGQTVVNIPVATNQDTSYEFDEDFSAFISSPRYNGVNANNLVNIGQDTAVGIILNDDSPPDITLSQPDPILEGDTLNRQRQNYNFTVNIGNTLLDPNREVLGRPITLAFTTIDGTAVSNGADAGQQDYEPPSNDPNAINSRIVQVPAGTRQFQYTVVVLGDDVYENDESFSLRVEYSPPLAGTRPSTVTGTIRDNDLPTYVINASDPEATTTVEEGNPLQFVIRLVNRQGNPVAALAPITFRYSVQNVSATLGSDFTDPNGGSITIAKGDGLAILRFPTIDDNDIEQTETFRFIVTQANGTIAPQGNGNVGVGTILDTADNNAGTVLTIQDKSVIEGTGGPATEMEFTVNLSRATSQSVSVSYQTAASVDRNPNARAQSGTDFTPTTGRITFAPGQTTRTFIVPITPDAVNELDETFRVRLFNPTNAAFANNAESAFATGTIIDDDVAGVVSVARADVDVAENVSGGFVNVLVNFTPTRGTRQLRDVTVDFTTLPDTAQQEGRRDYFGKSGTLTFRPGVAQQTIRIEIVDDKVREGDESFSVRLSNPNGADLGNQAETRVTILDDEQPPTVSVLPISSVRESATTRNFVIAIRGRSQAPVVVNYDFVDGTATNGQDYMGESGTVTFQVGGPSSVNVSVDILDDQIAEGNENFSLVLSKAPNDNSFLLPTETATSFLTIIDDEQTAELTIGDAQVLEGNPGGDVNELVFPVTLNRVSSRPVTFLYSTLNRGKSNCTPANGCDIAVNRDYVVARNIPVTIPAGSTTGEIRVAVRPDTLNEFNEQFVVVGRLLTNAVPAAYTDTETGAQRSGIIAYGTILNDDAGGAITIAGPTDGAGAAITTIDEGYISANGRRLGGTANFVVTLPAAAARTITVGYIISGDVDSSDYADLTSNPGRGQITFTPGQTTRTITLLSRSDNLAEGPEQLNIRLLLRDNNGDNSFTTRDANSTVTILDNTPQVTAVTPRVGFPKYGTVAATVVTIDGVQLRTNNDERVRSVLFNGVEADAATIQYVSDNSITVSVPDNATTGPITVRLVDGSTISTLGLSPTRPGITARAIPNFIVQPVITSFTPTVGVANATTITVVGRNFLDPNNPVTAVQFSNGAQARVGQNISITRDKQFDFVVPANASNGPISIVTQRGGVGPASLDSFALVNAAAGNIVLGGTPDRNAIVEGSTGTFTRPVRNVNGSGNNTFHRPYQFFLNPARQSGGANDGTALPVSSLTVRFQVTSNTDNARGTRVPAIAVSTDLNNSGAARVVGARSDANGIIDVQLDERFNTDTPLEVAIIDAGTDNLPPIVGGTPANVTVTAQIVNSSNPAFFPNTAANQIPTIQVDRVELVDPNNQTAIAFGANTRASFSVPFTQGQTDSVAISDVFDTPPMVGNRRRYTIYRLNVAGQMNNLVEGGDLAAVADNGRLERGIGYRIVVADNTTVQLKTRENGLTVPNDDTFSYSLTRNVTFASATNSQGNSTNGYNFIGFPFDPNVYKSVDFSQAQVTFNGIQRSVPDAAAAGLISPQLFTLDGNGNLVPADSTVINRFQAYFVQIFRDNLTLTLTKPSK